MSILERKFNKRDFEWGLSSSSNNDEFKSNSNKKSNKKFCITAPSDGVIYHINCEPGQYVTKGETVFSMEIMKMEIPISAPFNGYIDEICVNREQHVLKGDVLCKYREVIGDVDPETYNEYTINKISFFREYDAEILLGIFVTIMFLFIGLVMYINVIKPIKNGEATINDYKDEPMLVEVSKKEKIDDGIFPKYRIYFDGYKTKDTNCSVDVHKSTYKDLETGDYFVVGVKSWHVDDKLTKITYFDCNAYIYYDGADLFEVSDFYLDISKKFDKEIETKDGKSITETYVEFEDVAKSNEMFKDNKILINSSLNEKLKESSQLHIQRSLYAIHGRYSGLQKEYDFLKD